MQVYSTAAVPRSSRPEFWRETYSNRFARVGINPSDPGRFQAELKVGALGPVDFACVRSQPTKVERLASDARRSPDRLISFVMLLKGEGASQHCGREAALAPGDIVLSDSTEAMACRFDVPVEGITVRATERAFRARLPNFDRARGLRLPAQSGLTETAVGMARSLSSKLDLELPPPYAATAACHLLDVLATSYAMALDTPVAEASVGNAVRARAFAFIEANLSDPELSPRTVAGALGISPRYLRKLMAEQDETTSSVILRRRLEECAKQLSCGLWRSRSITDIAFAWGFNNTAHFARVFKSRYGLSPRDYRIAESETAAAR